MYNKSSSRLLFDEKNDKIQVLDREKMHEMTKKGNDRDRKTFDPDKTTKRRVFNETEKFNKGHGSSCSSDNGSWRSSTSLCEEEKRG